MSPPGPAAETLPLLGSARLWLAPLTLAQAAGVLGGSAPFRCAAGWPHEDTFMLLGAALARGEEPTYTWLVRLRDPDDADPAIGALGLKSAPGPTRRAEIGYSLAPPWRGRGLGREAVAALVGWAEARPDLALLGAEVDADNLPSRRLLEALGFELVSVVGARLWFERATPGPSPNVTRRTSEST